MLCLFFILFAITNVPLSDAKRGTESRIIGGTTASIENFPFAVQIMSNNQFFTCGGSIITMNHILSAAHCFVDDGGRPLNPSLFSIRAGSSFLYTGGTVVPVETFVLHPQYDDDTKDNDVAVLRVADGLATSNRIASVTLANRGHSLPDNSTVIAIGWGRTSLLYPAASLVLMQVEVRTVNWNTCNTNYLGQITQNMLCAGLLGIGGADSCQGDTGGPLIYNGVVVGITSFGATVCGDPIRPGVYVNVARLNSWIEGTVTALSGAESSRVGIAAVVLPLIFLLITS